MTIQNYENTPSLCRIFRVLHVFDVGEREDGVAVEAVAVLARSVLVRLPLVLLVVVLFLPVEYVAM